MSDYTIKTVAEALQIGRGCAADWVSRGYIKASMPSEHKGMAARFSREDIITAGLFKKLVERGFDREQARELVSYLVTGGNDIGKIDWAIFAVMRDRTEEKGYRILSWCYVGSPPSASLMEPNSEDYETFQAFEMITLLNVNMVRQDIDRRLPEKPVL